MVWLLEELKNEFVLFIFFLNWYLIYITDMYQVRERSKDTFLFVLVFKKICRFIFCLGNSLDIKNGLFSVKYLY